MEISSLQETKERPDSPAMKKNDEQQFQKMTQTPIPRLTMAISIPAVVSTMITMVYNMADTWFVAQIGTAAVGAVGVAFSITTFTNALGFLFGMGSGTYISRLLGARHHEEASRIGSTALISSFVLCMLLSTAGILGIRPLMRFLGSSETILPNAIDYGFYILLGIPVMCSSLVLSTILRCEGKTRLSMTGIGIGGILNLFLDPLFIFIFNLGVAGAAMATLLSQIISWLVLFSFYLTGKSAVRLSFRYFTPQFAIYRNILVTGLPSLCRHSISTLANIAMNTAAGVYGGDTMIAAMSIVAKVIGVSQSISGGIGQGAQTIFSYNKGAGLPDRVKKTYQFALTFNTCLLAAEAVFLSIFAPQIMTLFRADDAGVIQVGARALRLQCISLVLIPWNNLANQLLQSVGESGKSTFLASLRQGTYYIPIVFLLPLVMQAEGILYAQPMADVLTAVTVAPFIVWYFKRKLP